MPTDWRTLADQQKEVAAMGRIGLYAPGGYVSSCHDCGGHFEGDKRAAQCLPCAIKALVAHADRKTWIVQFYDDNDGTPLTYCVVAPDAKASVGEAFKLMVEENEWDEQEDIDQAARNTEVIRIWRGEIIGECVMRDIFPKGKPRIERFLS